MLAFSSFLTEEPSMLFLIQLLCGIFLYQPRACTSPQKGVTEHPLAWGIEHVLFWWSAFMSLWLVCVCLACVNMCLCVWIHAHMCLNGHECVFSSVSLPSPLCSSMGPKQSSCALPGDSPADRLLQHSVLWHPQLPWCPSAVTTLLHGGWQEGRMLSVIRAYPSLPGPQRGKGRKEGKRIERGLTVWHQ